MKRLLTIICLLLVSFVASAQISNVKTHDEITRVARFRTGLCSLCKDGDVYYLGLISTNKYDDPPIVYLGVGKESAMQTLSDLVDLHGSMGKMASSDFTIRIGGREYKYSVTRWDAFNFNFTNFNTAGNVYLSTMEMKNLITKLEGAE